MQKRQGPSEPAAPSRRTVGPTRTLGPTFPPGAPRVRSGGGQDRGGHGLAPAGERESVRVAGPGGVGRRTRLRSVKRGFSRESQDRGSRPSPQEPMGRPLPGGSRGGGGGRERRSVRRSEVREQEAPFHDARRPAHTEHIPAAGPRLPRWDLAKVTLANT